MDYPQIYQIFCASEDFYFAPYKCAHYYYYYYYYYKWGINSPIVIAFSQFNYNGHHVLARLHAEACVSERSVNGPLRSLQR